MVSRGISSRPSSRCWPKGPAYGWGLHERLGELFPFPENIPDLSTVYRVLGRLEKQGAIHSQWVSGDGAGRKLFELTHEGHDLPGFWINQFEKEQVGMAHFLSVAKTTFKARPRKQKRSGGRAG